MVLESDSPQDDSLLGFRILRLSKPELYLRADQVGHHIPLYHVWMPLALGCADFMGLLIFCTRSSWIWELTCWKGLALHCFRMSESNW